jgi:hypothetical protein
VRFGALVAAPSAPPAPWLRHVQRLLDALSAGDAACAAAASAVCCPPDGPRARFKDSSPSPPPAPGTPSGSYHAGGGLPARLQLELGWCAEAAAAALPAADLTEAGAQAVAKRMVVEGCCCLK